MFKIITCFCVVLFSVCGKARGQVQEDVQLTLQLHSFATGHYTVSWDEYPEHGIAPGHWVVDYELWRDEDPQFRTPEKIEFIKGQSYSFVINNHDFPEYYHKLRAKVRFYVYQDQVYSAWSEVLRVNLKDRYELAPPTIAQKLGDLRGEEYLLSWSNVRGAKLYEVQISANEQFESDVQVLWPWGKEALISKKRQGVVFVRVRGWSHWPENGGRPGAWSDTRRYQFPLLATPRLEDSIQFLDSKRLKLSWSEQQSHIYELIVSEDAQFRSIYQAAWPTASYEELYLPQGQYYFRVRSWSDKPEKGGLSSTWSNAVRVNTVPLQTPLLEDIKDKANDGYWLQWTYVPTASLYEIWVSTDAQFKNPMRYYSSSSSEYIEHNRKHAKEIYHKVRAHSSDHQLPSAWSDVVKKVILGG